MSIKTLLPALLSLAAVLTGPARLAADVVETKSGARIVGKVTQIDAGSVYVTTDYAGDIVIQQKAVASITTDAPVSVRLLSGTRMNGRVAVGEGGSLQILGQDGTITTSVDKVAATWAAGGPDPEVVALRRHWKYEATVNIDGTTGNQRQLGTGASFRTEMDTPQDALKFYAAYNRQVTNDLKSADQFKAGVDYSAHFGDRSSWFVRDEAGYDRIMDITFFNTAAAGAGYDFIRGGHDLLTGRLGLAYRYDGYKNPLTPTVNAAAADFEIAHDLKWANWELNNVLTVLPSFQDTKNVVAEQDSYFQVPLASPAWKLRTGVSNDYNSQPGRGVKRMDTTYYTHLILDWQ